MEKIDLEPLFEKSNLKFLKPNLIFATLYGSRAYGTHRPDSDIDVRGIVLETREILFGILENFEQAIFNEPLDCTFFGFRKFIRLAIENNPNILEIIFTDPSDHIFINDIGQSLLNIRESFLSKKCRFSLAGYGMSQLKRIKVHRGWLLRGEVKKPTRTDFKLPDNNKLIPENQLLEIEAQVKAKLESWIIDTTGMENSAAIKFHKELEDILLELKINSEEYINYACRALGLNDNLTEAFQKERAYKSALRDYKNWEEWKINRNKSRYETEEKFGYDLKHGMHLVRLFTECEEILTEHKLKVKRPDAEFLLEVRNGKFSYDELIEWAETKDKELNELYKTSTLRKEPDRAKINEFAVNTIEKFLGVI
jgi:predicted nucleotidyltransferase